MSDETVFYFAYGSNADPDRFRSRVGPWRSCRAASLEGYRLRFAASVQSESGGGIPVLDDLTISSVLVPDIYLFEMLARTSLSGVENAAGFANAGFGYDFVVVPEPGTAALLAVGLLGLRGSARSRRK